MDKLIEKLEKVMEGHDLNYTFSQPEYEHFINQILALTMGELKKEIEAKRANAFSVSLFGDREHQIKMDAMVNAYDVILGLIKEMSK